MNIDETSININKTAGAIVEQILGNLLEKMRSPTICSGAGVAHSFAYVVVLCRHLLVFFPLFNVFVCPPIYVF